MDISYLLFLQDIREKTHGLFDGFFSYITELGNFMVPALVMTGIYWCIDKKTGIFILFSYYLSVIVNGYLKIVFCVPRPWMRNAAVEPVKSALAQASGYSFPSSHAAQASALYGGIGAVLWKKERALAWLFFTLTVIILFSRNYLGVHTPQDVLLSAAAAVILMAASSKLLSWTDGKGALNGRDVIIAVTAAAVSVLLVVYTKMKSYPAVIDSSGRPLADIAKLSRDSMTFGAASAAFFIGWVLERRFIKFSVEGRPSVRLARFLVGAFLLLLLMFPFNMWCSQIFGKTAGRAAANFVTTLFYTAGYPALFTAFERKRNR